jgi:hypothetical protein
LALVSPLPVCNAVLFCHSSQSLSPGANTRFSAPNRFSGGRFSGSGRFSGGGRTSGGGGRFQGGGRPGSNQQAGNANQQAGNAGGQQNSAAACYIIGDAVLPKETADIAAQLQERITCDGSKTTISGVPDVSTGGVPFSAVNFATSSQTPLQYAMTEFVTLDALAKDDVATFQRLLDVYHATEAGIRSVGGNLAIKVPKFFLQMQISRIQTAQGNPPTAAGLQVDHLLGKILELTPRDSKELRDQLSALAKDLA